MKTCPRCGAENLQTASTCRLCAVPLEAPESLLGIRSEASLADVIPSTVSTSGSFPAVDVQNDPAYRNKSVCPACDGLNEPDWLFCQQCGTRLPPAAEPDEAESDYATEETPVEKADREPVPERGHEKREVSWVACDSCGSAQPSTARNCSVCNASMSGSLAPKLVKTTPREPEAILKLITDGGEVGETYSLSHGDLLLGRVEGDVTFSHDGYMSGRHASVIERGGRYYLKDENSRNGTFIRISNEVELKPGDTFLIGKQLLRFDKV